MAQPFHRHFVQELDKLKTTIIKMGSLAEHALEEATSALLQRREDLAHAVIADDRRIDAFEIEVDDAVVDLLALQQPVATDLRFLVSVLKINKELERIGDHAVNLAESAIQFSRLPPVTIHPGLPRMTELARTMLHHAIDGFIRSDAPLGREVLGNDDIMDELNKQVVREMVEAIRRDPAHLEQSLELIRVSRNLERVADLSTNIAEEVIFMAEARVVKHHFGERTGT
jgi:phosphate transport system protein